MPCQFNQGVFGLQSPRRGEGAEAAVESFLDIVGETTAGQFLY